MEYFIAVFFTTLCIFVNRRNKASLRITLLGVICTYVVVLMGLRYRVGLDTINYMHFFDNLSVRANYSDYDFNQKMEPAIYMIALFCKKMGWGFCGLQLIMAAITNVSIFIFLYRYCKNPFVGVLCYFVITFFYFTAEIMRESAAIGIFLMNFQNLRNKRWGRYYLCSFLSIAFHYSALITWLFPLAKYLKVNKWYIVICLGALVITPVLSKLNTLIQFASVSGRIDEYIDGNNLNLNWRIGQVIKSGLPALFCVYITRHCDPLREIRPFVLLQIVFVVFSFAIPIIFQRFVNYTLIFTVVYVANTLIYKPVRLYQRRCLFIILFLTQLVSYRGSWSMWYPYVSIYNPVKIEERELLWYNQFGRYK